MDDSPHSEPACPQRGATRRSVVAAAGVVPLLAACQVYEEPAPPVAAPASRSGPAQPLAQLDEIPIGGGKLFAAQGVVLSRPESDRVRAFSTVCTHQGCAVATIADGTINCPCHGSRFAVADGTVVAGPARRALAELRVTVDNNAILLA
jgi:nitrite reductase/ring-hydroxylating ferredoxin subunit